jgi:ABC-2 type transport system permease protein
VANPEWFVVGRREFMVRVRTKWFAIVTLIGPIGMIALILIPAYLAKTSAEQGTKIACLDHTPEQVCGKIAMDAELFKIEQIDPDTPRDALEKRIRDRDIDGYLILPEDLISGGEALYRGANVSNMGIMGQLRRLVGDAVRLTRARKSGLSDAQILSITAAVEFETELTTGKGGTASGEASYLIGYIVMFVLYMSILLYAVNVMRSVVEEKTSRVVEIMVSSVKPTPLMLGKIVGVGSVGLLQLALWAIMAVIIIQFRGALLGIVGISGDFPIELPAIGYGAIAVVMLYFFLGYFFYAALYAAVGAMVNSEQEAQQVQTPVVILLIIPVVCTQLIANDPRGGAAELLTLIPFSSPVLMPMRYLLGGASPTDVAISVAVLAAALAGVVWVAARIYRIGILMYGKRPSLRELARWVRQ